jgi:hypothetical protein
MSTPDPREGTGRLARSDQPFCGRHVWEHNNLAQKNLTIVDLEPNEKLRLPFVISNLGSLLPLQFRLELHRPEHLPKLQASLLSDIMAPHDEGEALDCAASAAMNIDRADAAETLFEPGKVAAIPVRLGPFEQSCMHFQFAVPRLLTRGTEGGRTLHTRCRRRSHENLTIV